MKHLLLPCLLLLCGCALLSNAQPLPGQAWITASSAPSGSCSAIYGVLVIPTGALYTCQSGTWSQVSGSAVTQAACDNSTKLATTQYTGIACNVVWASGSPTNLGSTSSTNWNNTSGAFVWNLPTTASGIQVCIGNYKTVAHAISLVPPSGSTIYYKGVSGTTSSATGIVSSGAAGDFICLEAVDTTTWEAIGSGYGTWTNN